MPRRVGLPGANELFRPTSPPKAKGGRKQPTPDDGAGVQHTGRVRHDEKITVYVSSEELVALEQLRLYLRAELGIAADRGRIVRAAIASALEEVSAKSADADMVRRLRST
ncbi:MAG: hypothetical protein ACK5LS_01730 [Propioniciclava sp.]